MRTLRGLPLGVASFLTLTAWNPSPVMGRQLPFGAVGQPAQEQATLSDDDIGRIWQEVFDEYLEERGIVVDTAEARLALDPPAARQAYEEMTRRFVDRVLSRLDVPAQHQLLLQISRDLPEAKRAQTFSSASTNPSATTLLERSGFSDLIALALDGLEDLVSADDAAVTVHLNALLLSPDAYETPEAYRAKDLLRRLGGSVTFGAELPQETVAGFSGFPELDRLFDVFAWDVKYQVWGDRDPRARQWAGLLMQLAVTGNVLTLVSSNLEAAPLGDQDMLTDALRARLGESYDAVMERLQNSWVITVKAAGQHLTNEDGMDKYSFAVLADKGLGSRFDLTINAGYSAVQDVRMPLIPPSEGSIIATGDDANAAVVDPEPFTFETWDLAFGLSGTVLQNLIVAGRGAEWMIAGKATLAADGDDVPVDRDDVWRLDAGLTLPFMGGGKIPVSITYTSDPNNLIDQDYVSGRIGISYDFGSLTGLFGQ